MSNYKHSKSYVLTTAVAVIIPSLPSFVVEGRYNVQLRNIGADDAIVSLIGSDGAPYDAYLPSSNDGITLDSIQGKEFVNGMLAYALATTTTIWVNIIPQDRLIEVPVAPAIARKALDAERSRNEAFKDGYVVQI
jgi:hypothetical protein